VDRDADPGRLRLNQGEELRREGCALVQQRLDRHAAGHRAQRELGRIEPTIMTRFGFEPSAVSSRD